MLNGKKTSQTFTTGPSTTGQLSSGCGPREFGFDKHRQKLFVIYAACHDPQALSLRLRSPLVATAARCRPSSARFRSTDGSWVDDDSGRMDRCARRAQRERFWQFLRYHRAI